MHASVSRQGRLITFKTRQLTTHPPKRHLPTTPTLKRKEKKAQGQMNTYYPFPDKYRTIHSIHFRSHRTGWQHCSLSCFSDTHIRPPHFLKALQFSFQTSKRINSCWTRMPRAADLEVTQTTERQARSFRGAESRMEWWEQNAAWFLPAMIFCFCFKMSICRPSSDWLQ